MMPQTDKFVAASRRAVPAWPQSFRYRPGGRMPGRGRTNPTAAAAAPSEQPIHYSMAVDVDYDKPFLNVMQSVAYQIRTTAPLKSLVFNVPPAAAEFNAFTLACASVGVPSLRTARRPRIASCWSSTCRSLWPQARS